jgi:hypothetical protein
MHAGKSKQISPHAVNPVSAPTVLQCFGPKADSSCADETRLFPREASRPNPPGDSAACSFGGD